MRILLLYKLCYNSNAKLRGEHDDNLYVCQQDTEKQWKEYYADFQRIAEHALEVLDKQGDYTISVILVKSRRIHQINRDYRQVDRPTDVISFAACDSQDEFELIEEAEIELGDIFINVEAAAAQAQEYGHSLRREICFLFTHGSPRLLRI